MMRGSVNFRRIDFFEFLIAGAAFATIACSGAEQESSSRHAIDGLIDHEMTVKLQECDASPIARSPSSAWVLHSRVIADTGSCELIARGNESMSWSFILPHKVEVLFAAIADDGLVFCVLSSVTNVEMAFIDSGGETCCLRMNRRSGRYLHSVDPLILGLVSCASDRRILVRVLREDRSQEDENWFVFDWGSRSMESIITPRREFSDSHLLGGVITCNGIAGTELLIADWYRYDHLRPDDGAGSRCALFDLSGRMLWSVDLPGNFSQVLREQSASRKQIREFGAIIGVREDRSFDIVDLNNSSVDNFEIELDGTEYKVVKLGSRPYSANEYARMLREGEPRDVRK